MNPKTPEKAPKIKYKVPIFLWFVEKSQRTTQGFVKKTKVQTRKIDFKMKELQPLNIRYIKERIMIF